MVGMPSPPDPIQTASAQGNADVNSVIASTLMNNTNEFTPYGSAVYDNVGSHLLTLPDGNRVEVPIRNRVVRLSPGEQAKQDSRNRLEQGMLDTAGAQLNRISDTVSRPLNFDSAPGLQSTYAGGGPISEFEAPIRQQSSYTTEDVGDTRRRTEEAIFSRLTPQFERDRNALESQLSNQGLVRGSQAFNDAMDEMRRAETDARFQAVLAGGQELSRDLGERRAAGTFFNDAQQQMFGMDLARQNEKRATQQQREAQSAARAAFANTARQQSIQEQMALRNQPINEMSAALSGTQVNVPQFTAPYRATIPSPPVADSVYRSYEAEAANARAGMSGLFGIGSALIDGIPTMLSDERAKTDVKRVGKTDGGSPIYSYRYTDGPQKGMYALGVMAQELAQKQPKAVSERPDGYLGVHYEKVR